MEEDELELLRKFKDIIEVSREVKKAEIAKYLGITEELLFEKLISWGKDIPFKIKGDIIEIDNMNDFIDALDRQFGAWENKEKSGIGKLHNKIPENSINESSGFVPEVSSVQVTANTKLQYKFEFLLDYAENFMN